MADLDSSFTDLRAEVSRTSVTNSCPSSTPGRGGVVVGNTFGHYDEHRADLEAPEGPSRTAIMRP